MKLDVAKEGTNEAREREEYQASLIEVQERYINELGHTIDEERAPEVHYR